MEEHKPRVIVVGGGFAGINTALQLSKKLNHIDLTLISDRNWHDYKACISMILEGYSASHVYIPIKGILKKVEVTLDKVQSIDLEKKKVNCGSSHKYSYDYLVLATGSTVNFHGVPTVREMTFTVNSSKEALELREHVSKTIRSIAYAKNSEKVSLGHIVVVGAGATGVEAAAAVAIFARKTAEATGVDPSLITVDLFHADSRILEKLNAEVSRAVERRLRSLGVNIFYNRRLMREHLESVSMGDIHIKADTLIWTAGVKPNKVAPYDPDSIDEYLNLSGHPEVYVIGDAGRDHYYGMAQTALEHAKYVSTSILNKIKNQKTGPYMPKPVYYAVPVGSGWAAVQMKHIHLSGRPGWLIRRFVDFRYMINRLPLGQAWKTFNGNMKDEEIRKRILE
jgi:NADH dehydrogenase